MIAPHFAIHEAVQKINRIRCCFVESTPKRPIFNFINLRASKQVFGSQSPHYLALNTRLAFKSQQFVNG